MKNVVTAGLVGVKVEQARGWNWEETPKTLQQHWR